MDHEEAIQSHAAERYVTRELSAPERDAFEEHFFDCPECAEEVRWEQIFMANGRAAVRESIAPPPVVRAARRPKWLSWRPAFTFSLAANAALACALVCALVIPVRQAPAPQLMQAFYAPGTTRGDDAADVHALPAHAASYLVDFDNQPNSGYSYEILDSNGRRESAGSLPAVGGEDEKVYLTLPVAKLAAGVHTLLVKSAPAGKIVSRSRFRTSN